MRGVEKQTKIDRGEREKQRERERERERDRQTDREIERRKNTHILALFSAP